MDIRDFGKDDLLMLVSVIGERLAKSIEAECISQVRINGLETELMEDEGEDENLIRELDQAREDIGNAKRQWKELTAETENLAMEVVRMSESIKVKDVVIEGLQLRNATIASEIDGTERELAKAKEEWLASAEISRANERRLERELKECRATVMNEVSAMIPKAVEAERGDLMNVLRDSALKCDTAAQSNILMGLVNEIKARGK